MSIFSIAAQLTDASSARLSGYVELTRPRLSLLVLFSVAAAGFAAAGDASPWLILTTIVGTAFVATSATIANQILELDSDGRMARTAGRPLPSGRISVGEATWLMALCGLMGTAILALAVNMVAALVGLATWVLYAAIYTPLKRHSSWNTAIGAIPGAMPVLIGWAATNAPLDSRFVSLFLILFFWQFPHFMAIAWMYRRDYAAGGLKMWTTTEPTGKTAGRIALSTAIALLPVSLIPVLATEWSWGIGLYAAIAITLGWWQSRRAFGFLLNRSEESARSLLRGSLVYLPLILFSFTMFTH